MRFEDYKGILLFKSYNINDEELRAEFLTKGFQQTG